MILLIDETKFSKDDISGIVIEDLHRELDEKNFDYCIASVAGKSHNATVEEIEKWYHDNKIRDIEVCNLEEIQERCNSKGYTFEAAPEKPFLFYLCVYPDEILEITATNHALISLSYKGQFYQMDLSLKQLVFEDALRLKAVPNLFKDRILFSFPMMVGVNESAIQVPGYTTLRVCKYTFADVVND